MKNLLFVSLIVVLAVATVRGEEQERSWSGRGGSDTWKATFVSFDGGSVTMKYGPEGKTVKYTYSFLSTADKQYVQEAHEKAEKAKDAKTPKSMVKSSSSKNELITGVIDMPLADWLATNAARWPRVKKSIKPNLPMTKQGRDIFVRYTEFLKKKRPEAYVKLLNSHKNGEFFFLHPSLQKRIFPRFTIKGPAGDIVIEGRPIDLAGIEIESGGLGDTMVVPLASIRFFVVNPSTQPKKDDVIEDLVDAVVVSNSVFVIRQSGIFRLTNGKLAKKAEAVTGVKSYTVLAKLGPKVYSIEAGAQLGKVSWQNTKWTATMNETVASGE